MQYTDEKLQWLLQPVGMAAPAVVQEVTESIEGLLHKYRAIEYKDQDTRLRRIVFWSGTLIVAGLYYYLDKKMSIVGGVYVREQYRRQGYGRAVWKEVPGWVYVPTISSVTGRLFFEAMLTDR